MCSTSKFHIELFQSLITKLHSKWFTFLYPSVNVSTTSLSADQLRTANVQTTPQDAKVHVTTQSSLLSLMLKVLTQAANQMTHAFHKNVPVSAFIYSGKCSIFSL